MMLLYNNILLHQDRKSPTAKYRTKMKSQILILGSRVDNLICDLDVANFFQTVCQCLVSDSILNVSSAGRNHRHGKTL